MKVHILTFNARGLNDSTIVDSLKDYDHASWPQLDIVAIQEHKLYDKALTNLDFRLWKQVQWWSLDTFSSYGHALDELSAGYGGVFTLLAPPTELLYER